MTARKCPKCNGAGFYVVNFKGYCKQGLRHVYSIPDGSRSDTCLRCHKLRESVKDKRQKTK